MLVNVRGGLAPLGGPKPAAPLGALSSGFVLPSFLLRPLGIDVVGVRFSQRIISPPMRIRAIVRVVTERSGLIRRRRLQRAQRIVGQAAGAGDFGVLLQSRHAAT